MSLTEREYDQICEAYNKKLNKVLARMFTGSLENRRAAERAFLVIESDHCREIMRRGLPHCIGYT